MTSQFEALAHLAPDVLEGLSDAELAVALFDWEGSLRESQLLPADDDWESLTYFAGRGNGKTTALAVAMNRRVEDGTCIAPALMAPTDDRVRDVQVSALIDTSPPWFKAEYYHGGARWPNGVYAIPFSAIEPGRPRSGNFDMVWLTELVDWREATRLEAFLNITTACRVGSRPQYVADTTCKGVNEVIELLIQQHEEAPRAHRIVRGELYDNNLLSPAYMRGRARLYGVGSREYREEVRGERVEDMAGALWKLDWIARHRIEFAENPVVRIVSIDPGLSERATADETGMFDMGLDARGHVVVFEDLSGRKEPENWAEDAVMRCKHGGASGVVVERNHLGRVGASLIKVVAEKHGLVTQILENDGTPFPRRTKGRLYIREYTSDQGKGTRAAPVAQEYRYGKVHHVGVFPALEKQLRTWEPGVTRKSPNRLDAVTQGVTELLGLERTSNAERDADVTIAEAAVANIALRERLRKVNRSLRQIRG